MKNVLLVLLPLSIAVPALSSPLSSQDTFKVAARSPLFQSSEMLELDLKADFQAIYKAGEGGNWHGEDRTDEKYFSAASLVDRKNPGRIFSAKVRARGMSSLQEGESSFPKIKLEISETEKLKGTLFEEARKFRINTHVATDPKELRTGMGRLNNENSPLREALAYQLAEALGIATPATRLARINYEDSGTHQKFTRNALLIESTGKMVKRYGAIEADEMDFISAEQTHIDPVVGAKFHLFHRLIGNDDVGLRVLEKPTMATERYRPIFNTFILETPDKKRFPVAYDFDLSTFISGFEMKNGTLYLNPQFGLTSPEAALFTTRFLTLRQRFTQAQLMEVINSFKSKKSALYLAVEKSNADPEGKKNALKHLDVFFQNVDKAMGFQVLASEGLRFYKSLDAQEDLLNENQITLEPGTLRPGTPIMILGKEKGFLKVSIININYDLMDSKNSVGYIQDTALIQASLPENLIAIVDERDMMY